MDGVHLHEKLTEAEGGTIDEDPGLQRRLVRRHVHLKLVKLTSTQPGPRDSAAARALHATHSDYLTRLYEA